MNAASNDHCYIQRPRRRPEVRWVRSLERCRDQIRLRTTGVFRRHKDDVSSGEEDDGGPGPTATDVPEVWFPGCHSESGNSLLEYGSPSSCIKRVVSHCSEDVQLWYYGLC